jgi:hypothetical protein
MRGRVISDDLRWAVINMAKRLSIDSICTLLGDVIGRRSIEGIIAHYCKTGMVTSRRNFTLRGKRCLTSDGVAVRPNISYLSPLIY